MKAFSIIQGCVLGLMILGLAACGGNARYTKPKAAMSFEQFSALEAGLPFAGTANCQSLPCQNLRQEFRYIVYVGKQMYCYWDQKKAETGTDFDALAQTIEASIIDGMSLSDYYGTVRKWASAFHDGHVNLMSGPDLSVLEIYSAPIRLEVLAPATDHEKIIIVGTGDVSGLSVGDEVLSINGLPSAQALDEAEKIVSGSTKRMRRFFATRRLVDALGSTAGAKPLLLKVLHQGQPVELSIARSVDLSLPPDAAAASAESTGAELFKATVLANGLGYLRIDGFTGSKDQFILSQAMDRLAGTKGLLIDLRKNGGGDQSGNVVLSRLITKAITRYTTSERLSDLLTAWRPEIFWYPHTEGAGFVDWHPLQIAPIEDGKTYAGKPVVALISPNCFSACDTFTAALKSNHLATIVGEATGGGTGSPEVFDLPVSHFQFRYSVVRGKTSDDQWIEGNGTTPDQVIEPSLQDRLTGRDGQLAQAVSVLEKLVPATEPTPNGSGLFTKSLIWQQRLDRSPTGSDEADLRAIAGSDER